MLPSPLALCEKAGVFDLKTFPPKLTFSPTFPCDLACVWPPWSSSLSSVKWEGVSGPPGSVLLKVGGPGGHSPSREAATLAVWRLPRVGWGQEQQVQSFRSERPACYLLSVPSLPPPKCRLLSWAGEAPGRSLSVSPFLEGWAVWEGGELPVLQERRRGRNL